MLLWRETADGPVAGLIAEAEAYGGPDDRASHARAGLTRRTAPMFGPPGHAYVYLIYGMHHCLNVVSEQQGEGGAVLLRALEPVVGLDAMGLRRGRPADPLPRLTAGPARLCQALGVDLALDGHDLTLGDRLWIGRPPAHVYERARSGGILAGSRVGVESAGELATQRAWRFGLAGSPSLSRPFRGRRDAIERPETAA
jgi:DNA-3-methyladenine glycosylase